jgi:hypothetical protein
MLVARGLQNQGLAFCQGLEKDLAAKDEWIRALEKELEATKKLAEENAFEDYQKRKQGEGNRLVAGAQRAANVYKDLIESVGEESKVPHEAPVVDFMEWLVNELTTVSDYMTIG